MYKRVKVKAEKGALLDRQDYNREKFGNPAFRTASQPAYVEQYKQKIGFYPREFLFKSLLAPQRFTANAPSLPI